MTATEGPGRTPAPSTSDDSPGRALEEGARTGRLLGLLLAGVSSAGEPEEIPEELLPFVVTTTISSLGSLLRRQRNRLTEEEWAMSAPRVELLLAVTRLGRPTMGELARALSVTPRAITRLVDGLEKDGHVIRERQEDDGRIVHVRLSAEALDRVATLSDARFERITGLSDGISAEDLRTTLRVLSVIDAAVQADLGLT